MLDVTISSNKIKIFGTN